MVGLPNLPQAPDSQGLTALRRLCLSPQSHSPLPPLPTNLGLDTDLPHAGLSRGKVHEWIGLAPPEPAATPCKGDSWSPPLSILIHLARSALDHADNTLPHVVWVARPGASGFSVRPYAPTLGARSSDPRSARDLLASSLFVSASSPAQRLWAADLALRGNAAAVIVDATNFDLASTRRLQLAAESGAGICFLARPPWEQSVLSASSTRWLVRPSASPISTRRWTVSLLRCKGMQPAPDAPRLWTLERDHATRAFSVVPDLRHRPHQTQTTRLSG